MFTVDNAKIEAYLVAKNISPANGLKLIGVRGCLPIGTASSGQLSERGDPANIFSDTLGCFGTSVGLWPGTTVPGVAPAPNPHGLAHLCTLSDPAGKPWKFVHGSHHGQYPCLIQGEPISVRRDNDFLDTGNFGIEIHHAGVDSQEINNWSEGCQVFQRFADWNTFWSKVKASGQSGFVYYLLDGADLVKFLGV